MVAADICSCAIPPVSVTTPGVYFHILVSYAMFIMKNTNIYAIYSNTKSNIYTVWYIAKHGVYSPIQN